MEILWHDVVGSIGVTIIVGTYLLLQLHRLNSTMMAFSVLNAVGAALIIVSLSQEFNFSALIVEAFWLLISVYGMLSIGLSRSKKSK